MANQSSIPAIGLQHGNAANWLSWVENADTIAKARFGNVAKFFTGVRFVRTEAPHTVSPSDNAQDIKDARIEYKYYQNHLLEDTKQNGKMFPWMVFTEMIIAHSRSLIQADPRTRIKSDQVLSPTTSLCTVPTYWCTQCTCVPGVFYAQANIPITVGGCNSTGSWYST